MIPILYENTEQEFATNGIGRLSDCISCTVTEERNGVYECQFQYPITGIHYDDIRVDRIIAVIHDDRKDIQPFDIYKKSAPLNGVVTFYAHHVSYRLGGIMLRPFTAQSAVQAMAAFVDNSMNDNPFTFWTDKSTVATFKVEVPVSNKAVLGGMQGSILDVYGGGEYQWDKWLVKLYQNRGTNTDVEIRYGKNLTDLKYDCDISGIYSAVAPYWRATNTDEAGEEETIVTLPEGYIKAQGVNFTRIVPLDLSSVWQEAPTEQQLRTEASRRLASSGAWLPKEHIKVNFIALWQTEEYKNIAPLQRVSLCDTVKIIHPEMGVNATAKIIRVVYDVLNERYNSMELGEATTSFSATIAADLRGDFLKSVPTTSMMQAAIIKATKLIAGGLGGYVVINQNADGQPNEILIMDTNDISTAVNVLRINKNGIGFSSNGYNGPFRSAWTLDGSFVADFITSGNLNANLITTGIITDRNGRNYWNLDTGEISISVEPGEEGEVTHADLERVYNNAKTYAESIGADAKDYTDIVRTEFSTQLSVSAGQIMGRVSSQYATKTEVGMAVAGNIILQIPYHISNNKAHFRAIIYRSTEEVTDEFPNGAFEWFFRSEAVADREPLGYGKRIDVDINRVKYGMTVICRFNMIDEPVYWTAHDEAIITDHENEPFLFLTTRASLEAESAVYQPNYTESRFAELSITDSEIRAEVERKINENTARSLISQTADAITQEVTRATKAEGTLKTSIAQTAESITSEVSRAKTAEGNLSSRITQTADSISSEVTRAKGKEDSLSSRITQNATSITSEVTRAKNAESSLSSSITQTASSITAEVTNRKNADNSLSSRITQNATSISSEVSRAKGKEDSLSSSITQTANKITSEVTRAKGVENSLSSRITQTDSSITSEVTRAKGAEGSLSSRITQTANKITSEVTRAKGVEDGLGSRITQTNSSITAEITRAKDVENSLGTRITATEKSLKVKITSEQAQTLINASADAIRLKTGTIAWSATNSSLTSNGVFTTKSNAGQSDERSTVLSGGYMKFYKKSTLTGSLRPMNWVGSSKEGVKLECSKNSAFLDVGFVDEDDELRPVFVVNNGLNPNGYTEKAIIYYTTRFHNDVIIGGRKLTIGDCVLQQYAGPSSTKFLKLTKAFVVTTGSTGLIEGKIAVFDGDIWVRGQVGSSDERQKDIVKWDDKAEDFLLAVEPIMFKWNDKGEDDRIHVGFGAQTTERVLKDLNMKADAIVEHDEKSDVYGISYIEFIPLLVKTIQRQERRIRELEKIVLEGGHA